MRIGIDIRCLAEPQRSGVGEYTFQVLDNLFRFDRQNEYFLFYNSFKSAEHNLPYWKYENVKFVRHKWPNKLFNLAQFIGWPKIDKLCGGVDVFWMPNWHFASFSDRVKLILTIHDLSHLRYPEFLSIKKYWWHKFLRIGRLVKLADKIIAVSKNTESDLIDLLAVDKKKIRQVYSGVTKYRQIDQREVNQLKNKFEITGKYILSVGTREPRKNLIGVIQAFEKNAPKFKNLNLVIVGGEGWSSREINRLIAKSEFIDRIKVLDYVSEKEKQVLYAGAEMLVYPSFYEGFGLPPLEAMSYGCSVIASLNSSLSEVVGDAGMLVDPQNLKDLEKGIENILLDKYLRDSLVEKGYNQTKSFDWHKAAVKVLENLK